MKWKAFLKEPRIIILILFLVGSLVAIQPHYETQDGEVSIATNIKTGLDLKGGIQILAEPEENITLEEIERAIGVLQSRVNAFGLQEVKIRPLKSLDTWLVQIEMAGAETQSISELIEQQGTFEARISVVKENGSILKLGSQEYSLFVNENGVKLGREEISLGEVTKLSSKNQEIEVELRNFSDGKANLSLLAFSGTDIKTVFQDAQHARVSGTGSSWSFQFQVLLDLGAAERFKDVIQDLKVVGGLNSQYLSSPLELYLDGNLVDSLNIASSFKSSVETQPSITGGGASREEAVTQMKFLQTVLDSGNLPSKMKIVSSNSVSATLGAEFARTASLAIGLAIVAVSLVVFIRYRRPKIAIPILITGVSELVIILGIASSIGWTIDLAAIAGIIAAIGTGVDDQIVITDERTRKRESLGAVAKMKRAFFIIFTAAATTIGAMFPLTFVGAGAVTGFAVTTILGVLTGVFITRPAYARIINHLES